MNDDIRRKLETLREAARYDCGSYIRELIDDLAAAIIAEESEHDGERDMEEG